MDTTTRKKYDKAFRDAAVRSWRSSNQSIATHAAELGIPAQTLTNWVQKSDAPASALEPSERRRFERLLREKEEEIAILSKAAAYFARAVK